MIKQLNKELEQFKRFHQSKQDEWELTKNRELSRQKIDYEQKLVDERKRLEDKDTKIEEKEKQWKHKIEDDYITRVVYQQL